MNSPWTITDTDALEGTCYIELQPGPFEDKHWQKGCLFFAEEHFACIEPIIESHFQSYDHYGMNEIPAADWSAIMSDLRSLAQEVRDGAGQYSLNPKIRHLFRNTQDELDSEHDQSLSALASLCTDIATFAEQSLETHDTVSVLGI